MGVGITRRDKVWGVVFAVLLWIVMIVCHKQEQVPDIEAAKEYWQTNRTGMTSSIPSAVIQQ